MHEHSTKGSRGFHRLGLFLAAVPLVVGSGFFISIVFEQTNAAKHSHDEQLQLVCAQALAKAPTTRLIKPGEIVPLPPGKQAEDVEWRNPPPKGLVVIAHPDAKNPFDQFDANYDLKELGCSEQSCKVSWHDMIDAPSPEAFSYSATLLSSLWWYGIVVSIGVALAVYVVVRAIGWVIAGLAAS